MFRKESGMYGFDEFACWHVAIVLPSPMLSDVVAVVFGSTSLAALLRTVCRRSSAMVLVTTSVHPNGLHPLMQIKAWHMHEEEGMSLDQVCKEVPNMQGGEPSLKCVWSAAKRVAEMSDGQLLPETKYANCGLGKIKPLPQRTPSAHRIFD